MKKETHKKPLIFREILLCRLINDRASIKCMMLLLTVGLFTVQLNARQSSKTSPVEEQKVEEGRELFTGKTRLANKGPSCMSCHTIDDAELKVSGGTLALNITSFGNLPPEALKERILKISLPHMKMMQAAYANHPVTEKEASKIIAYLKSVSQQEAAQSKPMLAGINFLWTGLTMFLVILGIIWFAWHRRKKGSVNDNIYQRQTQTV